MQKTCAHDWCKQSFEVTTEDLAFYDKVSPVFGGKKYDIPPPPVCPECRQRQRMIWRPELHLFQRKSDLSGDVILSKFPPSAPCTVYSSDEWWSDRWNPFDYGKPFDFSRPFFEQFAELLHEVPLIAVSVSANENSDYINSASWNKNCYLLAGANYNEDCYYGNFVNHCHDCIDCSFIDHCDLCYECVDCAKCYALRYSQNCSNCSDSFFLFSCRGCRHCFGSVNLIEKEYVYLNEQLSKEDYERRMATAGLDRRSRVQEARAFFQEHRLQYPHKFMIGEMNEDVTGNGILRSRHTHACFDVSDLEDCKYCTWFHQGKNCMDCYAWGFPAEECYSCMEVGNDSHRVLFSLLTYNGLDLLYSYSCRAGCKNLFGCVSLKKAAYCILNTQYTKEEYDSLLPRIIEHMRETGEWGTFFPMSVSPLAYNQTIVQDYFPLTKESALERGAKWNDETPPVPPKHAEALPDAIGDSDDGVLQKIYTCSALSRPFKIIQQELQFYRTHGIPLPDKSFAARHGDRLQQRNPRKLWNRVCAKCGTQIATSYAPGRPEIVYCESCYLAAVY